MARCDSYVVRHSQERGIPHSVVGLLFSFQRPSHVPGSGPRSLARTLTVAESRRQPCSVKGGGYLADLPVAVKWKCRHEFGLHLPAAGRRSIIRDALPVKEPIGLGPRRLPRRSQAPEGPLGTARKHATSASSRGPILRGRALYPPARRGVKPGPRPRGDSSQPDGILSLLPGSPPEARARPHPVHASSRARARAQAPAAAAAAGSAGPPRRARSAREIATRRASASSRRSFTTT